MFDAMILFCVIHELGGEPANQCFAMESEQIFRSYEACRKWADTEEITMSHNGLKETGKLFVTQISCGDYEG